MPQYYKLKKTLVSGTSYRMEPDKFFVAKKAGTNSTTAEAVLRVGGVDCLKIFQELARLNATQFIRYDLLELGDYSVVIPPDKEYVFTGDSGSRLILEGVIGELAPKEPLPSDVERRFANQGVAFIDTFKATVTLAAAGGSWAADAENVVLDITCGAGERYIFDDRVYVALAGLSAVHAAGDVALRFYYQGKPLDILSATAGKFGIDVWAGFWNDGTNYYYYPISLEDMPIQLEPGRNLRVAVRNVRGAAISAASGTALTATVGLVSKHIYLP